MQVLLTSSLVAHTSKVILFHHNYFSATVLARHANFVNENRCLPGTFRSACFWEVFWCLPFHMLKLWIHLSLFTLNILHDYGYYPVLLCHVTVIPLVQPPKLWPPGLQQRRRSRSCCPLMVLLLTLSYDADSGIRQH